MCWRTSPSDGSRARGLARRRAARHAALWAWVSIALGTARAQHPAPEEGPPSVPLQVLPQGQAIPHVPDPPQAAAAPAAHWTLVVPKAQAIRMQRSFQEVTPDAPAQGPLQLQQGVNPWAQLLVYAIATAVSNKYGREQAANSDEVIVSTDVSVGQAVAMNETATAKRFSSQEEANRALAPYAESLKGTTLHALLAPHGPALAERGGALAEEGGAATSSRVHVAPKFVFSFDQRTVHADALIGFGELDASVPEAHRQAMRVMVHSAASDAFDITDHWLRDDAKALRQTMAQLLLSAVDLAAARQRGELAVPGDASARTFRFRLGSENTYVRGKLIRATCSHVLLEALQGHWVLKPSDHLRDRTLLPAECRGGG